MSDKKIKMKCHLITRGTEGAEAQANDDLNVSDPEPAMGKQIIEGATEEDKEDGDQPTNS